VATVSFLWHLHQPAYRTADGTAHAPWVALHAGGSYTTLASAIVESGGRGQVLNIVPTLLEQLLAYRDGTVRDPLIDILSRPVASLSEDERATLVEWGHHVNPRQIERSPRLGEIGARLASTATGSTLRPEHLRDLQVLLILAHACDQAWRDPELEPLAVKGRRFSDDDHRAAVEWLRDQPGRLVELWRRLAELDGVEIATSPYAHPIMPLLIDSSVVVPSWAPDPAPEVPVVRRPADALRQLDAGLDFMKRHDFSPVGCWPPEGSVSADALGIYGERGIRWLVTDEGILERSLGQELRADGPASAELYRGWRLDEASPVLFFRDRVLSDRIGFEFGGRQDESAAAAEFVDQLVELARRLPDDAAIVVALDGENPWPHYPACGGVFLRELLSRLNEAGPDLEPVTLAEAARRVGVSTLPRLHPGSWIHATFSTWIGHPEKTAAWELLTAIRDALPDRDIPPSMLLAEGSDWFWWLGDDNPTELAPLYDRIFRQHLADACAQSGVQPPIDLTRPIKAG
jgi:alpha-amylase/alpha-mannosidase (GH57 family)